MQSRAKQKLKRIAMHIELDCARCSCHFVARIDGPDARGYDPIEATLPWDALGDGNTFEDALFTKLMDEGASRCPRCGQLAPVSQESLGALAMEMLSGIDAAIADVMEYETLP
jgi:hypothetical protein